MLHRLDQLVQLRLGSRTQLHSLGLVLEEPYTTTAAHGCPKLRHLSLQLPQLSIKLVPRRCLRGGQGAEKLDKQSERGLQLLTKPGGAKFTCFHLEVEILSD
jgi:hypothetical protein